MKPERLVEHLDDAVRKLGYTLRLEKGDFRGGSCVFDSERLVFVNRRMGMEERAEVLAKVLAKEDLEGIFLVPEVRAYVEKFSATLKPSE
jgi:hypothetical protein